MFGVLHSNLVVLPCLPGAVGFTRFIGSRGNKAGQPSRRKNYLWKIKALYAGKSKISPAFSPSLIPLLSYASGFSFDSGRVDTCVSCDPPGRIVPGYILGFS